ncbi:MAG: glycosyltransferase family 2 protein [Lachnospiraceae bacterium]|nr:glycosyltransferase family 2 protein [Lachnospiraceae bacterium]
MLKEMIESVRTQSYENWELCIADGSVGARINADGSVESSVGAAGNSSSGNNSASAVQRSSADDSGNGAAVASSKQESSAGAAPVSPLEKVLSEYHEKDPRIVYKVLDKNGGISYNTNYAFELATGDFIALLDHDDIIEPDALFEVVKKLQNKETKIVYTDEDKVSNNLKHFMDPNLKPDFSIDLFRSHNYITHFYVVSADIYREVGGEDSKYDGAQDYEFMFRCIEKALNDAGCSFAEGNIDFGADKARSVIAHVPRVLYHWRLAKGSTAENPESKMYAYESGRAAVEEHLKRMQIPAKVEMTDMWGMYHAKYEVIGNPLVSIIIPSKDHTDDLDNCIRSIVKKSAYKNIEFIIAENNSESEETFGYYEKITEELPNVKVVKWEKEFNYAAINNFAAKKARGEYFLFLNNDTELITETAISEMLAIAERKDVGIVGAKLLYPDDTVQHAGILLGFGGYAQHAFVGIGRSEFGFMVRARINCNYNAVTGACLMISKDDFEAVSGFSEDFPVAGNDVDLCLKVRKLEKLVVYNAFSEWYHYESKSRGYEDTPEKKERFEREVGHFRQVWSEKLAKTDEYYNPNFDMNAGPYEL